MPGTWFHCIILTTIRKEKGVVISSVQMRKLRLREEMQRPSSHPIEQGLQTIYAWGHSSFSKAPAGSLSLGNSRAWYLRSYWKSSYRASRFQSGRQESAGGGGGSTCHQHSVEAHPLVEAATGVGKVGSSPGLPRVSPTCFTLIYSPSQGFMKL